MGYKTSSKAIQVETRIQEAIKSIENCEFPSIRADARHFDISHVTLGRRIDGSISHRQANKFPQIPSNAEEKTLVRWITPYTCAGSPMTSPLLIELGLLVRRERVRRVSENEATVKTVNPIGHEWVYRFLNRHSTIKSIYARQMDNARFDGASYEVIKHWFDAVAAQLQEHPL